MPKALIWIDGGCAPKNPGHAGIGIVIKQRGISGQDRSKLGVAVGR